MKTYCRLATVALSALAALLVVLPSLRHLRAASPDASAGKSTVTQRVGSRAIPIKNVGEFDRIFTDRLNRGIAEMGTAAKGTTIFKKKIFRSFISTCLIRCNGAQLAPKQELTQLRTAITAEMKRASSAKASLGDVAQGQVTNNFFVGDVHKLSKTRGDAAKNE